MKDITRIHIAKVSYDIELLAKKSLEAYITKLEAYAQDDDVLEDIEIRITELLHERGVKPNGVIVSDDVKAVCAQLGDPKEFMTDGDVVVDEIETGETRKQLYRNGDTALVGGVLSGIASYFNINLIVTRLAFVFLTFVSAGLALFVYIILWFITPVAKTAAEKLSMTGRPVTLTSIRQLNEKNTTPNNTPRVVRRVVTAVIGTGAIFMTIGVIAGTVYGVVVLNQVAGGQNLQESITNSIGANYPLTFTFVGIAIATLIAFLVLMAYSAFKQIFSRRIWLTGIVLIAIGLMTFGASIASVAYGRYDLSVQAQKNTITKQVTTPAGFDNITELSIKEVQDFQFDAQVQYFIDSNSRIELVTPRNDAVKVVVDGERAELHYVKDSKNEVNYRNSAATQIKVYGPSLKKFTTEGMSVHYQGAVQPELIIDAKKGSSVTLSGSRIDKLTTLLDESFVDAQSSTVGKVQAELSLSSSLRLGTVSGLTINAPTTCAALAWNEVHAVGVNDGFVLFNNIKITKTQYQDACMRILSAGDEMIDSDYDN